MKKRKSVRVSDFKRWLKRRPTVKFGCGSEDCPLHDWLDAEMSNQDLDDLPAWCSRFVGHWDAIHDRGLPMNGARALEVLDVTC